MPKSKLESEVLG